MGSITRVFSALLMLQLLPSLLYAQCTEAKDADMAKYKRLAETQDAQGCSQCAMLALYFCSARYSVKQDDIQKVGRLIEACKQNIRNMGQPYCCPELLGKQPEWGKGINGGSGNGNSGSGDYPGAGTASSTESGSTDYAGLAEKYRQKMKDDTRNGTRWAFCSAAALAKSRMGAADFANYAKRIVASLKQGSGAGQPNPCPEILGPYWDGAGTLAANDNRGGSSANSGARSSRDAPVAAAPQASGGAGIIADNSNPSIKDDKSFLKKEVSVSVDRIPGFVPGTSVLVPGEIRGSYRGLYLVYLPDATTNGRGVSRIYKKHGRDWMRSEQEAVITSIWISSHPDNESMAALNYYWTGAPAMKESISQIMAQGMGTVAGKANLGSYNSPGHSFANDNPPTMFLKITGDKARYNLWGFGDAPPAGDLDKLGHAHLYRVNDQYSRPEGQRFDQMDVSAFLELSDVIMEGSVRKGDNHIWIAQGSKLFKAQPDGRPFTFKTLGFPAAIRKVRVTEEWVWVLAGSDLYRIGRDDMPRKYYRINSGSPSFAVDANFVYCNDGYAVNYSFHTRRPLLGEGPSTFTKTEWASLKGELGSLELECAPGEHTIYFVNGSNGKVYTILTY